MTTAWMFDRGAWRRFRPGWPFMAGCLAFLIYCLTLSPGAFPGVSADLMTCAAGLAPDTLTTHPLWLLLTGWLARVPIGTLALRLNLFNALCAAVTVGLLGSLMEIWLFGFARDPLDGTVHPTRPDDEESGGGDDVRPAPPMPLPDDPVVAAHNRRAAAAARMGAQVAALTLACGAPFWSAATRLHLPAFDLLLLLLALHAVRRHTWEPAWPHAVAVALLCGAGCIESPVFLVATPLLFLIMLVNLLNAEVAWGRQMLAGLLTAACGALAMTVLLGWLRAAALGEALGARAVIGGLARAHLDVLRHALPASGWVWIVALAAAPAAVMLFVVRRAFGERSASMIGAHVAMTVAALLCVLNTPVSPWGLIRDLDYTTALAALAVAALAGYLTAYWRMLGAPLDQPEGDDVPVLSDRWAGVLGALFGWPLAAAVLAAVMLNLGASDGRPGAFADALADDVIDRLGTRTWLVSNGIIDSHIRLRAHERHRRLNLVGLSDGANPVRRRRLLAMIDAEPAFAARRDNLHHAVALGTLSFLQDWLNNGPEAENRLLVVGAPEIWALCGYRPVACGFAFMGTRHAEAVRGDALPAANRAYWNEMARMLAPNDKLPPGVARLRALLRREAGRGANNLGVLLEDLARPADAYEAYAAAGRIDPLNLSALLNQHALALAGTHPETARDLERRLKKRLALDGAWPSGPVIVRAYGDIRQPRVLAMHGLAWSENGQPELARAELLRAIELAPADTRMRLQFANLALRQEHTDDAERSYQAVLAAKPGDPVALAGMASVALSRGRPDEARQWLERARQAGVPEPMLGVPTAALLGATGQGDAAFAKLRALTDGDSASLEAWALLAEQLLRRKNSVEVERRVLPAMIKAAGSEEHVLIHLVRAKLLGAKQPPDFAAARNSLLLALKLRPDFAAIRDDLLALDLAHGGPAVREQDASEVLRVAPDHALANYLLATVLLERGELPRAEALFRRSLAARATAAAHNDLAETLRRARRLDEAEQSARAALALDERAYAAWDTLGCVLLDRGRPEEAARAVERALALRDTDPRIHLTLARILLAQGRGAEACGVLDRPVLKDTNLPPELRLEAAALRASAGQESGPSRR